MKPELGDRSHCLIETEGGAWVTGKDSVSIPFRHRPRCPQAWFDDPPGCGPQPCHGDVVFAEAINMGHHFRPRWFLKIYWEVKHGVRLIRWSTD
jgi:hypothetical protein